MKLLSRSIGIVIFLLLLMGGWARIDLKKIQEFTNEEYLSIKKELERIMNELKERKP